MHNNNVHTFITIATPSPLCYAMLHYAMLFLQLHKTTKVALSDDVNLQILEILIHYTHGPLRLNLPCLSLCLSLSLPLSD